MKKISVILAIGVLLLCSACSLQKDLDLNKIEETIGTLKTKTFDPSQISKALESTDYSDMAVLTQNQFESIFKVKTNLIESYVGFKKDKDYILVIKPTEDNEEEIKGILDEYFSKDDVLVKDYQEYIIYIKTLDNQKLYNAVISSKKPIFSNLVKYDENLNIDVLGIDKNKIEDFVIMQPAFIIDAKSYYIIKPKKEAYNDVKIAMDEYMTSYEAEWEMNLQDQYQLVKNRTFAEYNGYLIYIISEENETVLTEIKKLTIE